MRDALPSPKVTPPGSLILPPSPLSTGRLDAPSRGVEAFVRQVKRGGIVEIPPSDLPAILNRLKETDSETWGWLQDKPRYANPI
jgi:hypothetical protein